FVYLAVIEQAACAVAPVIRIAGDAVAELEDGDTAALADRRIPPVRAAAVDKLVEFVARDDALIGRAPRLVVRLRHVHCVGRLRATNLDKGRGHCEIEATKFLPFKPHS